MYQKIILSFGALIISLSVVYGQNCRVFSAEGDNCKYAACVYLENAPSAYQFSRQYQEKYDKAIEICPRYDYAYRNKSTPYLKSGDFLTWKKLMDKAVALNPTEHLSYRGWCRFQFFNDYKGAIKDIEFLDSLVTYDIGYSVNGTYHLNVAKALCYKRLGQVSKAVQILQTHISQPNYSVGLFDYLHLGVMHLEMGNEETAIKAFNAQSIENELAENQYYLAQVAIKKLEMDQAKAHLLRAKELYMEDRFMFDPYSHQVDKVYLLEIEEALAKYE